MILSGLPAGGTDLDDMAVIGAATTAQNLDLAIQCRLCLKIHGSGHGWSKGQKGRALRRYRKVCGRFWHGDRRPTH